MKKIAIAAFLSLVLMMGIPCSAKAVESKEPRKDIFIEKEDSKEIQYQDIFMTFLNPYIEKAVEKYYGAPYPVDPWANDILSIEQPNGFRTFYL